MAAMRIPGADQAIIAEQKLVGYLLNPSHPRGRAKARLLHSLGYDRGNPQALADDLRRQHLTHEPETVKESPIGTQFIILGPIRTPRGRTRVFKSVWQIDRGDQVPRLITMVPQRL